MASFAASKKDEAFRQYALTASPMRLLLSICTPLALYQALQSVFKIIDSLMAAHISANAASTIAAIAQITAMISAIGTGLASGGSIKVSEAYGRGDYEMVRRRVATIYTVSVIASAVVAAVLVPFAEGFLRLLNTPEELITEGAGYFRVEIVSLIVSFLGNVYIAIEKSRGHTRRIMFLNLAVIAIKLGLSAYFVYVLNADSVMIAVATLISQSAVILFAAVTMPRDEGAFRFSVRNVSFKRKVILPVLDVSYPLAAEKVFFNYGKVQVNSMSGVYGGHTVGALGISNNIGGLTTSAQNGMADGATALISQNRGAGKYSRTVKLFNCLMLVNIIIGVVGLGIIWLILPWMADVFASSRETFDSEFRDMIIQIHRYEMLGYIALGMNSAANALLLGYGHTKIAFIINVVRVFVYRIPILWFLQHFTDMRYEAVGVTMFVSNLLIGITSVIIVIPILRKIRKLPDTPDPEPSEALAGEDG